MKWCIIIAVMSVYNTVLFIWMMWPTFIIAQQSKRMRASVSKYIHSIIESKILKNDETEMNEIENGKNESSISELLHILNRLLFLMDDDRCFYHLLGVEINKDNARSTIILLTVTRILTLLFVFK